MDMVLAPEIMLTIPPGKLGGIFLEGVIWAKVWACSFFDANCILSYK